ncbi:MAG TPA: hypothetical protein VIO16_12510 [Dehalococcoidia bacterium]
MTAWPVSGSGTPLPTTCSTYVFYAPVRLSDATFGIAQAEIRTSTGHERRTIRWVLFGRSGLLDSGELDLPAVAIWQALAHVERLLREQGIWLDAGDQQKA